MERRSRGRGFKSTPLHTSVSRCSDMSENRSKSARVRAICDRARIRRASLSGRSARIGQFLSPRDLPRSADHRHAFAYDSAVRDLQIIAHHHPSLLKQSTEQLDHRSRPPCSANASTKAQPKRLAGIHAEIELVDGPPSFQSAADEETLTSRGVPPCARSLTGGSEGNSCLSQVMCWAATT